jgi:hypothetical protein
MEEEKNDWTSIFLIIGIIGVVGFVVTAMFGG